MDRVELVDGIPHMLLIIAHVLHTILELVHAWRLDVSHVICILRETRH